MPAFHCPMGAPFFGDEECIECKLCQAKTTAEMITASHKIREYLRSEAGKKRKNVSQKIAVCGKGGTGKSTVVTLMAKALREEGYSVLVIDTDESNPGLHRMLGFSRQPKPLISIMERFSPGEVRVDTSWMAHDEIRIENIPAEYLVESDGLKFLMVGKIEDPFQGCACAMADIVRDLMGKIILADNEIVIVDMEAGIESFGRGVERHVDTVLIVTEPSYESMALAEKISYMADGIGVNKVLAILNKVPSAKIEAAMETDLLRKKVRPLGAILLDPEVSETGFLGQPLGDSTASETVKKLAKRLLDMKG
jgi:CO dehydrogenase maturation factor